MLAAYESDHHNLKENQGSADDSFGEQSDANSSSESDDESVDGSDEESDEESGGELEESEDDPSDGLIDEIEDMITEDDEELETSLRNDEFIEEFERGLDELLNTLKTLQVSRFTIHLLYTTWY